MTITIEELRKVYQDALRVHPGNFRGDDFQLAVDAAILALARHVAERQRAVGPTPEMELAAAVLDQDDNLCAVYRAMSAVAPLVVPE